jgi:hypothetical protein
MALGCIIIINHIKGLHIEEGNCDFIAFNWNRICD